MTSNLARATKLQQIRTGVALGGLKLQCIATAILSSWSNYCCRGDLCLMHSFSVCSENIAKKYTLPKTRFLGLHFCCKQYGSNYSLQPMWYLRIWEDTLAKQQPLCHSMSFKVDKFQHVSHVNQSTVYLLSCTVSETWWIIGPIFTVISGSASLTHSLGWPLNYHTA